MKKKGYDGRYSVLWSPSRITTGLTCKRQYYYAYLAKPKPQRFQTPAMFAGKLLHERIETFYNLKPGKNFGKPKKKTAKEFADSTVGMWKYWVWKNEQGEKGDPIIWKDEQEAYRVWAPLIHQLAMLIYEDYSHQKPPLFAEFETPTLVVEGKHIYGIIDEIRHPLIIRDHKSRRREASETDLKYDRQFTAYAAIVSFLSAKDNEFGRKIGATEEDIKELKENPLSLLPKITLEHHFLETGFVKDRQRRVEVITAPKRKEAHFFSLMEEVDDLEAKLREGNFKAERGNHCNYCQFKQKCDEDTEKEELTQKPRQEFLFLPTPPLKPQKTKQNTHEQLKFDFA